ncbi:MAG: class I SAM-dependent methyltransferase [Saprospiraceae bacterium]|nr:class I SAM-dependent methyltransferase [Saprospiraceae bacterium]
MRAFFLSLISNYFKIFQFLINIKITRKKIKKHQHLFSGKLLDIGAGDKPYKKLFSSANEYIGTNTKRHYEVNNLLPDDNFTDIWIDDASKLPFDDNSFDGVLCFQVLSVIKKPNDFFNEVSRVLKPGGNLMLTTDFLYPKWSKEDVMRHTDVHLKQMCAENSLDLVSIESFGGFFTMWYSLLIRFVRSYPATLSKRKGFRRKLFGALFFMLMFILTPIIYLKGLIIYLCEKNITDEFDYTMDLFLVARKKK